jgi:hypothetical protein
MIVVSLFSVEEVAQAFAQARRFQGHTALVERIGEFYAVTTRMLREPVL